MSRARAALSALLPLLLAGMIAAAPAAAKKPRIAGFGVDAKGRTVIAVATAEDRRPLVARFTSAGALDPSFAHAGVLRPAVAGVGLRVAVQPGGGVVLAGRPLGSRTLVLRRYRPAGRPDRRFGGKGRVRLPYIEMERLFVQPGGRILSLATRACSPRSCGYLYRNLYIDRFAPRGRLLHSEELSKEAWNLHAAGMASDGSVLISGGDWELGYPSLDHLSPSGARDRSPRPAYGIEGGEGEEAGPSPSAIALRIDGSFVIADLYAPKLWGYRKGGGVASGFGADGVASCGPPAMDGFSLRQGYTAAGFDAAGRLLAAGGEGECGLVRYDDGGLPDAGFGAGGFVDVEAAGMPRPLALAPRADGSIMVAGWDGETGVATVARYGASGELDAGFGAGGFATIALPAAG